MTDPIEPPGIDPPDGHAVFTGSFDLVTAAPDPHVALVRFVNGFRADNGVSPLAVSPILSRAARAKAMAMATSGVMAHELDGTTAKQNAINHGYPANAYGGENILWGQPTAEQAFAVWRDSPPHRANMLSTSHKAIGVGGPATASTKIKNAWAQVFGRHVDAPAPTPPPPALERWEPLPAAPLPITPETPFRATGACSLAAFNDVLDSLSSPIPHAERRACWEAFGDLSAIGLSQLVKESSGGGTTGARATHNPLGLMGADGATLFWFPAWADACREWYRRMTDPTYKGGVYGPHDLALGRYIKIYVAGPNDGYANGETPESVALYLMQTIERVALYRETQPGPGPMPPTPPTPKPPVIYDLAKNADAARFGLTPGRAAALMRNRIEWRNGLKPRAIVWHIQDGSTPGSLAWWLDGPNVSASATVMIQRDGSILKVIPEAHGPWTNGDVNAPTDWGRKVAALGNGDPNAVCLTIEAEGKPWDNMPAAQADAIVWQTREWMRDHGIAAADVGPHAALNSTSRPNCPGLYYAKLKPLLGTAAPGPLPQSPSKASKVILPAGMTLEDAAEWFGREWWDPNGSVSVLWLEEGARTGVFPALVLFDPVGTVPRRFRFVNGTVFVADASGARVLRRPA